MKTVVFDLDGTLVDSAADLQTAANRALADEGGAPLDLPTIASFIGNGLPKLVERAMQRAGIDLARHAELTQKTLEYYHEAPTALSEMYPGVERLLAALHKAGHKIGLCTNKPEAASSDILADFGIEHYFSSIVGGDTLDATKPDAGPLRRVIEELGGDDVIYVGDSEVDYQTALNADVPFAFFKGGYRKQPDSYFEEGWHFDHFDHLRLKLVRPVAFLFDVDGTLAETEEVHRMAFNKAFEEAGHSWNWSQDDYRILLKTSGGKERIAAFLMQEGTPDRLTWDQITQLHLRKTSYYTELLARGAMPPRKGVMEIMEWARAKGIALAICTTTSRANVDALVKKFWNCDPEEMFAAVMCAEDASNKKPDPEVYLKTLEVLELGAAEAVAFEDSVNGIGARAGCELGRDRDACDSIQAMKITLPQPGWFPIWKPLRRQSTDNARRRKAQADRAALC